MAQELDTITKAFEAYEKSLLEERYYDAHEDIEAIWFPRRFEKNDEVNLWKGFINAAVCFELIKKGRPNPSQTPWNTYLKYRTLLEDLETDHYEIYVRIDTLIQNRRKLCPSF